jgi:hypothetical protein
VSTYERLRVDHPRVGTDWGYLDLGDYHFEVVEFGRGFGWKLHLFSRSRPPTFLRANYCSDPESAWREICTAYDEIVESNEP